MPEGLGLGGGQVDLDSFAANFLASAWRLRSLLRRRRLRCQSTPTGARPFSMPRKDRPGCLVRRLVGQRIGTRLQFQGRSFLQSAGSWLARKVEDCLGGGSILHIGKLRVFNGKQVLKFVLVTLCRGSLGAFLSPDDMVDTGERGLARVMEVSPAASGRFKPLPVEWSQTYFELVHLAGH